MGADSLESRPQLGRTGRLRRTGRRLLTMGPRVTSHRRAGGSPSGAHDGSRLPNRRRHTIVVHQSSSFPARKDEPPQPPPIPVLALGKRLHVRRGLPTGHRSRANPSGHASPQVIGSQGGNWLLPTNRLGLGRLRRFGAVARGTRHVRYASLRVRRGAHSKNRVRKVQGD